MSSLLDDNLISVSNENIIKNAIRKYMAEFGPHGRNVKSKVECEIIFPYSGMISDCIKHPKKYFLYFRYGSDELYIIVASKQYYSRDFIPCTDRPTYMKGYCPLSLYHVFSKIDG